jgi:hypothetical protein
LFNLKKVLILAVLLISGSLAAQSTVTTTTSTGFSGATDAVGVYSNGAWSAGSHITQSFDLIDFGATKANHVFVQGNQWLYPTLGYNFYTGGFEYQPNVGNLFSKTNIPSNTMQLFLNSSVGVGTSSTGPNHIVYSGGGGVRYNFNSALSWNSLQGTYQRFGNQNIFALSSGLLYVFGPKATTVITTPATAAKTSILSSRQ